MYGLKEVISLPWMATKEDDMRMEEELLRLDENDFLVLELMKKAVSKKREFGLPEFCGSYDITSNNGHSLSEKQVEFSMYKLYKNGRAVYDIIKGKAHYFFWNSNL